MKCFLLLSRKVSVVVLALAMIPFSVPTKTVGQAQDLPGTVMPDIKTIRAGSLVIPMDNIKQGNAAGTIFNIKSYGLAITLLHAGVPLYWVIRTGKAKDAEDFAVAANKIAGTGGGTASGPQSFSGGPLVVYPGYETVARSVITTFNGPVSADDVVVYETTADTTADVRYTLTHKPLIGVADDNASIHTKIFSNAGLVLNTHYRVIDTTNPTVLNATTCLTYVTQPHTDKVTGIPQIRVFVVSGGNFFGQCHTIEAFETNLATAAHFQTSTGYVTQNVNTAPVYLTPDMPQLQFIGGIDPNPGGSVMDFALASGSSYINNAFQTITNSGASAAVNISVTSKLFAAGPGGMVFYLGGHDYDGTSIILRNGQRMVLNGALQPPTRPGCPSLGAPLIQGFKSVRLGTQVGDDVNGNGRVEPGDTIEWTINYFNAGSAPATNFQIADTVPGTTTFLPPQAVTFSGSGTSATANLAYNGSGNLLDPGAVLDVNGLITVTVRTRINLDACPGNVCPAVVDQASATGTGSPITTLTDNVDNTTPGLPFTVPPGSFPQDQRSTTDPTVVPVIVTSNISGNVFHDTNGLTDNTVNGTGTNVNGTLFVNLLNGGGLVIATTTVNADGTYSFIGVPLLDYTLQLTTNQGVVGEPAPTIVLPPGWVNTGENIGTDPGSDGKPDSALSFTLTTTPVTNANFGIQQRPTADNHIAPPRHNPGGTISVEVVPSLFSGTDPDGTITSIRITDFPSNTTSITINGVMYTEDTFPDEGVTIPADANGHPLQTIELDPANADNAVIPYVTIDNAGFESLPATATLQWSLEPTAGPISVSGRVVTADGVGIYGAILTATNAATGERVMSRTNAFGFYTLDQLSVATFYSVTVTHRRYVFSNGTRIISPRDDVTDFDFTADPDSPGVRRVRSGSMSDGMILY